MTIYIEDLKFQCILGILYFERTTPQDVLINLTLEYEYTTEFINYAEVVHCIKMDLIETKYLLIEDALKSLSQKLKKEFYLIDSMKIKITKPSILPECRVSVESHSTFKS